MRFSLHRRGLLALALGALALAYVDAAAAATGALTQKPATAGCISEEGAGGACTLGVALGGAWGVTVSPDGKSVYVASSDSSAVAVFDRDAGTGELTQKPGTAGCISEDGTSTPANVPGSCADGVALDRARSVAVSPDGISAYVASRGSDAVAVLDRDSDTGELTQKPGTAGCISEDGTGGACTDGVALDRPRLVAISPDGTSVYVASWDSDAVAVLDRDSDTGELTQKPGTAGCIGAGGACTDGVALNNPESVTVSPDGKSVYVASAGGSNAVAVFDRDPDTGELTQKPGTAGCISEDGTGGACADGVALLGASSITVSPDGTSAYAAAASWDSNAVAVFDRDTTTGALTQKPGTAGCIAHDITVAAVATCANAVPLWDPHTVIVSPDGTNVYVASGSSGSVTIFNRNTATGRLIRKPGTAGCIAETPYYGACTDGVALNFARSVAVSPDGASVYVASQVSDAVAVFDRSRTPEATPDTTVSGSASAKKAQKQKGKKIVVKAKVKAKEDLTAKATGKIKIKKKSYKLKSVTKSVSQGNSKNLQLKPKKSKHAKKIVKAMKKGKKAKAKLEVKLTDEAGNRKTTKLSVKLKR